MAEPKDTKRTKGKVSLKVSAPHVSVGGGVETEELEENNAKARKGALFLAAVVGIYIVYLIVSGQMGEFLDALSSVDTG